jgi:cysteine desulfurase
MRIGNTIYLDHHATTPVDPRVLAKMAPHFNESFGNANSVDHVLGWAAARVIEEAATQVAGLIRCDADEIIFTSGATEANNLALIGLSGSSLARTRRRVLLGSTDHKSVLATGRFLEERGFIVAQLRVDPEGLFDFEQLREELKDGALVVSISLVNSEIGTIQNLQDISTMARQHGALVHCDAAQAPCAMNMHEVAEQADLVSLSAHKIYGPKGIGALYIRRDIQRLIAPIIHGGGQQRNLRSGTLPTPLCVGFGAAAALLTGPEADKERDRIRRLRDLFLKELGKLSWPISLNGSACSRHPGNANIQFQGSSAEDLLAALQPQLAASTASACTSGILEPSHVLRGIGLSEDQAASSVRFCIGRYTTDTEIRDAVVLISEGLEEMSAAGLREIPA